MDDIQLAQVAAAEDAVVQRLREKGLLPTEEESYPTVEHRQRAESVAIFKRQHLESALATAFVSMQASYDARKRQELWLECLRLAKEIERLNKP